MDNGRDKKAQDPITAAVAAMLRPIVADAVRECLEEHSAGELPKPSLVDDANAAHAIGVSVATLRKVLVPAGAPHLIVGCHRRWKVETLIAWLERRTAEQRGAA